MFLRQVELKIGIDHIKLTKKKISSEYTQILIQHVFRWCRGFDKWNFCRKSISARSAWESMLINPDVNCSLIILLIGMKLPWMNNYLMEVHWYTTLSFWSIHCLFRQHNFCNICIGIKPENSCCDFFHPKMPPTLAFYVMYRKSFIYCRNRSNSQ